MSDTDTALCVRSGQQYAGLSSMFMPLLTHTCSRVIALSFRVEPWTTYVLLQVRPFTQIAPVPRRSQPQVCRSISSGRIAGFAFAARTAKRLRIIHEYVFAAHDAGQLARRQLLHIPALTLAGWLLQSDIASAGTSLNDIGRAHVE